MATETVGQQVQRRRAALGLSVRQFAERSGVHRNTVAKVEADDPRVEEFTNARVLRALDDLERKWGIASPDETVSVLELPDGTRVTFTGSAEGVAEAARAFLRDRK